MTFDLILFLSDAFLHHFSLSFIIVHFKFQSQGNVKVCHIMDDVKDALKKFRFRKSQTNAALICKCIRLLVCTTLNDAMNVVF